ncbi:MAG: hypothetical protein JNL74_00850, partial [Fibrobacteres bacterium]|nr:hypothetical protein [Fibrobacterota bacterium]
MTRKYSKLVSLIFLFVVFLSANLLGGVVTWDGSTNSDWDTPTNWTGNAVPGASDTVVFDGSVSSANCQTNIAQITVAKIEILANYTGTISHVGHTKMNIGVGGTTDAFVMSGGTFVGSIEGDSIIFKGAFIHNGGTFTSTNGTLTVLSAPFTDTGSTTVFNHNNGRVHLNGKNVSGLTALNARSANFYNLDLTMGLGTCVLTGANKVYGTLTVYDGVGGWSGDTISAYGNVISFERSLAGPNVLFTGAQNQSFTANGGLGFLGKVLINKSGGTLTLSDSLGVTDNFYYVAGTVNPTGTVRFEQNNKTISSGAMAFNHVVIAPNGGGINSYVAGTMDINGDLTLVGGASSGLSNGAVTVAGNLTGPSAFTGTSTITLDGPGTQLISGCFTNAAFTINKPSGVARLAGNTIFQTTLDITSGSLDQGASFGMRTGGLFTIGSGCSWTNSGTGYDSLGGNVTNNGTITFGRGGAACSDAQYIKIRSTTAAARLWNSGTSFTLTDVDAKDMNIDVSRTFSNSISSGNNTNVTTTNCADAAKHIWMGLGADNNWSTALNWNPPFVPASTDSVVFNGTSTKQSTIDGGFGGTVKNMIMEAGYTDTVKMGRNLTCTYGLSMLTGCTGKFYAASYTLTFSFGWGSPGAYYDFSGGMFLPGTGKLIVSGSGSGYPQLHLGTTGHTFNKLELSSSGGSWGFKLSGANMIVLDSFVVVAGGFQLGNSGVFEARGHFVNLPSSGTYGRGTIIFNGTTDQTINCIGDYAVPNITINKPSGTLTMMGTITCTGNWSHIAGTVNPGVSTVTMIGGSYADNVSTNGMSFYNLRINSGWETIFGSNIDVSNDFSVIGGYGIVASGRIIRVGGNWLNSIGNRGTVPDSAVLYGTGNVLFNPGPGSSFANVYINKPGGTVTLNTNRLYATTSLYIADGTFSQGTVSGVRTGGNITISSSASWINNGTGYDSLGGNVNNSGTVNLGRSGNSCLDGQYIVIRSTNTTQRLWSGSGTFNVADVDVSYMTGSITAVNSFNSGNNGWTLLTPCVDGNRHYWYASTAGNWNIATNWTPPYIPAATDTVIFSSLKAVACSITTNTTIGDIRMNAGYNIHLSKRIGTTLTIGGGGFTQNAGTFNSNNGTIRINGDLNINGGTFNSTPDTLFISGIAAANNSGNLKMAGGVFNHNNGVVKFDHYCETYTSMQSCSLRVNGKLNLNSLVFYSSQNLNWINTGVTYNLRSTDTIVVNGTYLQGGDPASNGATRCIVNGGIIEAKGPVNASLCATGGNARIIVNGNTSQTYTHSGGRYGRLPTVIVNTTGSFSANTGTNSL